MKTYSHVQVNDYSASLGITCDCCDLFPQLFLISILKINSYQMYQDASWTLIPYIIYSLLITLLQKIHNLYYFSKIFLCNLYHFQCLVVPVLLPGLPRIQNGAKKLLSKQGNSVSVFIVK